MLGVGLRKLCPQDSFGYAFRKQKTVRKSTPGGCKSGPRRVQNGLWKASGRLFCASRAPLDRQGRSKAELGRLRGRSWGVPGNLGVVMGASWAAPGASRAALGRLLGPSGRTLAALWAVPKASLYQNNEIVQNIVKAI